MEEFVPYSQRAVLKGETLPHSDGVMMTKDDIRQRIALLRAFRAVTKPRDLQSDLETEMRILEVVLGERLGNFTTAGEFAMDLAWTAYGVRPDDLMDIEIK